MGGCRWEEGLEKDGQEEELASLFIHPVILCLSIECPCGNVPSLPREFSTVNSGDPAFPICAHRAPAYLLWRLS